MPELLESHRTFRYIISKRAVYQVGDSVYQSLGACVRAALDWPSGASVWGFLFAGWALD